MPHNCDTNAGIVLIDTEKESFYALLIDKNKNRIEPSSTSSWNDEVAWMISRELMDSQFKIEYKNNKFSFQK